MISLPLLGQKVDTIDYCRREVARLNLEIEDDQKHPDRYPIMNSAFVQFNHQVAAHMVSNFRVFLYVFGSFWDIWYCLYRDLKVVSKTDIVRKWSLMLQNLPRRVKPSVTIYPNKWRLELSRLVQEM